MFTGIVEEIGQVASIKIKGVNRRLTVSCSKLLPEIKVGDSVSVSGVCLTAVETGTDSFAADLAQETWLRTSFSRLRTSALVNLELPMRASGRFDGHVVQGHVDGTGTLVSFEQIPRGQDYRMTLTVASIDEVQVQFAIIPHTAGVTNLHSLRPGDPLNLEVDVIAKYVEKMMTREKVKRSISIERLVREGF
jgi:riboflavin synthase